MEKVKKIIKSMSDNKIADNLQPQIKILLLFV